MFQLIDDFIENRLKRVLFNGAPIPVYTYVPDRDKEDAKYPAYAFKRLWWKIDYKRARDCEVFKRNVDANGDTVSWSVKPHPIPITVVYQLHARATSKPHCDQLGLKLIQAFPAAQTSIIGDQCPLVMLGEDPHNDDDTSKPLYDMIFMLWFYGVWIERLEEYLVDPVTGVNFGHEINWRD